MKKTTILQLFTTSVILLIITSCGTTRVQKGNYPIYPPDFAQTKAHILIVEYQGVGTSRMNRLTKEDFEKYYTGSYDFIDSKDVDGKCQVINAAYGDIQKYRFVFVRNTNLSSTENWNNTSGTSYQDALNYSFTLFDRKTNTIYRTDLGIGKRILEAYVQKLEAAKNQ
jgi:hypothetical protein